MAGQGWMAPNANPEGVLDRYSCASQSTTLDAATARYGSGSPKAALRARWDAAREKTGADEEKSQLTSWPIVLQKSEVARLRIFRKNMKRGSIADSYALNRVTEADCEFSAMR